MTTYCLTVQYDGSRYNGWQKQGNTPNTIQEKIETVLERLYDTPIEIAGSGRTDAGVHALGQTASYHVEPSADHFSCDKITACLNQYLPADIRVLKTERKEERFHARLLAKSKTYEYRIDLGSVQNVFERRYSLHLAGYNLNTWASVQPTPRLDLTAMEKAAGYLLGTHDFKSFCDNKRMKKSSVRTLFSIDFRVEESALPPTEGSCREAFPPRSLLTIRYCGSGFLYHMVRILTGTLLEVGLHRLSPDAMPCILNGKDRALSGPCVPPQGLFLTEVSY